MSYRERRLRRAERLREWADKRTQKSAAAFQTAHTIAHAIPFGQPILVGHHSERHARRDQDRIHGAMSAGVEHERKAESMTHKADELERQADASIYSDDEDAIERLQARIAELEAQRARIKAINTMLRKCGPLALAEGEHTGAPLLNPPLTAAERAELIMLDRVQSWYDVPHKGFPPYYLQNLSGNLNRQKKRLAALAGTPAPAAPVPGDTATARAGLVIEAGMTTPHRPGKAPRPVWTVRGNLGPWRPLLLELGGSWYRSAFSFWDDPTDAIEAACIAAGDPA